LSSDLVVEYRQSTFAAIWQKLWKIFPNFANKHSPFFPFEDGAVLWNQGFGNIAYLQGERSVIIEWSFEAGRPANRIIHLSSVNHWDPPHDDEQLNESEIRTLHERLKKRFHTRGETVVFR
jgi:hypothetical protein